MCLGISLFLNGSLGLGSPLRSETGVIQFWEFLLFNNFLPFIFWIILIFWTFWTNSLIFLSLFFCWHLYEFLSCFLGECLHFLLIKKIKFYYNITNFLERTLYYFCCSFFIASSFMDVMFSSITEDINLYFLSFFWSPYYFYGYLSWAPFYVFCLLACFWTLSFIFEFSLKLSMILGCLHI